MRSKIDEPVVIDSVAEYKASYGLAPPRHPLITVFDLESDSIQMPGCPPEMLRPVVVNLYMIAVKRGLRGRRYYGRNAYDFGNGVLYPLAPGQISGVDESIDTSELSGTMLLFHAELPLGRKILDYGFFGYTADEALHLSEAEQRTVQDLLTSVKTEYDQPIDLYSQDVTVSLIELTLTYTNRYYNRQFITRKHVGHDLLTAFEEGLRERFHDEREGSIPSVQSLADELNVSQSYLSDMLRTLTGQTTQQHIHQALIEKAKRLLLTTSLSVNETAYRLGFEYPQYFSRLFKTKVGITPGAFRRFDN